MFWQHSMVALTSNDELMKLFYEFSLRVHTLTDMPQITNYHNLCMVIYISKANRSTTISISTNHILKMNKQWTHCSCNKWSFHYKSQAHDKWDKTRIANPSSCVYEFALASYSLISCLLFFITRDPTANQCSSCFSSTTLSTVFSSPFEMASCSMH